VPLKSGGEAFGVLCVVYHRDHWVTTDEQRMLDLCAAQAATAIVNARMHRALASSLDWLLDETARSYHSMIGPHLAIVRHTMENVLAEKLGSLTPKQADRLGKAKEEIDTLTQRIECLLLLRRLEAGHVHLNRRETRLPPLIQGVVARLQPWAREKRIAITCNVDRVTCALELDGEKIESIVDELLANAIKFTPPGGRVELRALQRQQRVLFWIRDTGVGIAPAHLNMIFEKYFQVTRLPETSRAGVGLGLYLARKFAELHGGRIDVKSQLGRGTTFTLTLPRHAVRKPV
jgi:signal transduction histidine kinase